MNLEFVRRITKRPRMTGGIICRARNGYPLTGLFRVLPVHELQPPPAC